MSTKHNLSSLVKRIFMFVILTLNSKEFEQFYTGKAIFPSYKNMYTSGHERRMFNLQKFQTTFLHFCYLLIIQIIL